MKILAIETSCDETAAAIVEDGTKIIANNISSSVNMHEKSGGIIPEIAAREQVKYIIPIINRTIKSFDSSSNKNLLGSTWDKQFKNRLMQHVDVIAVTIGPGLIGSLLIGVETAKTIAYISKKPIIPVNHIFAHIYANWLTNDKLPQFPAIALVVSGGHTELFFMKDHNNLKWLGGTRDDAAGEAFDKTARLLGLGYPGGPAIAAVAAEFRVKKQTLGLNSEGEKLKTRNQIKLPRPMIREDNLDFSFSGLKTAVIREINRLKKTKQSAHNTFIAPNVDGLGLSIIQQLAYEVQEAITDVLVDKTLKAAKKYQAKSILLGGGVAANKRLAEKMKLEIGKAQRAPELEIDLFIPPPSLCTDNAAYIASYAYFHNKPVPWQEIQAKPDLEVEV